MKKGISVSAEYDVNHRWCLKIEKQRGKLTLDEIKECAREWEWDFYLLVLDCFHEEYDIQYGADLTKGDMAVLYRTDLLYENGEH